MEKYTPNAPPIPDVTRAGNPTMTMKDTLAKNVVVTNTDVTVAVFSCPWAILRDWNVFTKASLNVATKLPAIGAQNVNNSITTP